MYKQEKFGHTSLLRGDVQVKKVFTSLAPLKKIRPGKKTSLFIVYLLVVALLIALVFWRGLAGNPLEITQYAPGEVGAGREEQPAVTSERSFDSREDGLAQGLLPKEDAQVVQAMPQEAMRWPLEGPVIFAHQQVYRIGKAVALQRGYKHPSGSRSHSPSSLAWDGGAGRKGPPSRLATSNPPRRRLSLPIRELARRALCHSR